MSLNYPQIQHVKTALTWRLSNARRDFLKRHPIDRYISLLDSGNPYFTYEQIPDGIREQCLWIERETSRNVLEDYHKLVMLTLIETFETRSAGRRMPESVTQCFFEEFKRMISEMESNRAGLYLFPHNSFVKDLAICRLKLYPCGPALIDVFSGVPRRTLFQSGVWTFFPSLRFFLFQTNGFRPFYQLHIHHKRRTLVQEFNPEGWIACYRRTAELLKLNSHIKGVFGTSWWLDSRVKDVSPHVGYLREQVLETGGRIFFVAVDKQAANGATKRSRKRKRMFETGEYVPRLYMAVWWRDDLIRWATKEGRKQQNPARSSA